MDTVRAARRSTAFSCYRAYIHPSLHDAYSYKKLFLQDLCMSPSRMTFHICSLDAGGKNSSTVILHGCHPSSTTLRRLFWMPAVEHRSGADSYRRRPSSTTEHRATRRPSVKSPPGLQKTDHVCTMPLLTGVLSPVEKGVVPCYARQDPPDDLIPHATTPARLSSPPTPTGEFHGSVEVLEESPGV